MYKKLLFAVFALLMPVTGLFSYGPSGGALKWQTNYEDAMKQAKLNSKPVVLFFTGSDWCTWCNKLDQEVFDAPDFATAVGDQLLFVKLDFPLYSPQDPQLKAQNKQLQQQYSVRSFPTVIVLDPQQNKQIGTTGYRAGGAKAFAAYLLKMVNDYKGYKQKMGALDQMQYSGQELQELYGQANDLHLEHDAKKIITAGIDSDTPLYFLVERYRHLASEGLIHSKQAHALRQQLLAADPTNHQRIPYQLAMIAFETYCLESDQEHYTPELAAAPLVEYIEKFGERDRGNVWHLQMIISQIYLDKNHMISALKYAQYSYEHAPATTRSELARAVHNIRSQIHSSLGSD